MSEKRRRKDARRRDEEEHAEQAEQERAETPAPVDEDPDFAEEWTPSETDPAAQDPSRMGSEAPHRPTRTDGGPHRPV